MKWPGLQDAEAVGKSAENVAPALLDRRRNTPRHQFEQSNECCWKEHKRVERDEHHERHDRKSEREVRERIPADLRRGGESGGEHRDGEEQQHDDRVEHTVDDERREAGRKTDGWHLACEGEHAGELAGA